jgi:hypothetical protein
MAKPGINKNSRFHQGVFVPNNPKKYKGTYPLYFKSNWELKMMRFLDLNENIIFWGAESIKIRYSYFDPIKKTNSEHTYYPDFIVQILKNNKIRTQIVEIKPYRETRVPRNTSKKSTKTMIYETVTYAKNQAKWNAAKEYCRVRDWDFLVLTERDLP